MLVENAMQWRGRDLPVVVAMRRRLEQGVTEHGDDISSAYLTCAPG